MLNYLQKNPLASAFSALATFTGLLTSASAQAVSLSQNGQGQVLIYPYYTVRGGTDSYLSVLNGSDIPTVVMLRFRSASSIYNVMDKVDEVRLVTLYLDAHDQWTGGVTATAEGAKLISFDQTCTHPRVPQGGLPFVIERPERAPMDATREGFFEVIEMGRIQDPVILAAIRQTGGARSCTWEATPSFVTLGMPTGALSGTATLINVANGTQYSYQPVALENFSDEFVAYGGSLDHAKPAVSQILHRGRVVTSTWNLGSNAVSAVLMHASMINEFVLESTTLSGTDWVVTLPTRDFYNLGKNVYRAPFASAQCQYQLAPNNLRYWDREARSDSLETQFGTSLPATSTLCGDVSVLTFNNSKLLASAHSENLETSVVNGWAELSFEGQLVSREGHIYRGLPLTGFMVHDFVNGNVGGLLSNYGGNFDHKYTTEIDVP
ncbi:MAG: hypothetical protein ABWY06_23105 [Pseudomonas sp.]|uniref:hypothetical protein n=1 Tax=Pseudomonas sp. TaxID=306 RepID=UPI0033993810